MSISLSKNFQIGLNDIREMINLCNENREHMNLKEVFKLTTNQNLSEDKKNKEWTNDIIERLGMFVSEKYDSIEQFLVNNITHYIQNYHLRNFIIYTNRMFTYLLEFGLYGHFTCCIFSYIETNIISFIF